MKICETREFPGGIGGGHLRMSVYQKDTMPADEPGVTRFRAASKTPDFEFVPLSEAPVVEAYSDKDADTAAAVNSGTPPSNTPT
jgi:hypothetical protein